MIVTQVMYFNGALYMRDYKMLHTRDYFHCPLGGYGVSETSFQMEVFKDSRLCYSTLAGFPTH